MLNHHPRDYATQAMDAVIKSRKNGHLIHFHQFVERYSQRPDYLECQRKGFTTHENFEILTDPTSTFRLKPQQSASKALTHILDNGEMLIDCGAAVNVAYYLAILWAMEAHEGQQKGRERFDALFGDANKITPETRRLVISPANVLMGLAPLKHKPQDPVHPLALFFKVDNFDHKRDLPEKAQIGDCLVFAGHPNYCRRHPLGTEANYTTVIYQKNPLKVKGHGFDKCVTEADLYARHMFAYNASPSRESKHILSQLSFNPSQFTFDRPDQIEGFMHCVTTFDDHFVNLLITHPIEMVIMSIEDYQKSMYEHVSKKYSPAPEYTIAPATQSPSSSDTEKKPFLSDSKGFKGIFAPSTQRSRSSQKKSRDPLDYLKRAMSYIEESRQKGILISGPQFYEKNKEQINQALILKALKGFSTHPDFEQLDWPERSYRLKTNVSASSALTRLLKVGQTLIDCGAAIDIALYICLMQAFKAQYGIKEGKNRFDTLFGSSQTTTPKNRRLLITPYNVCLGTRPMPNQPQHPVSPLAFLYALIDSPQKGLTSENAQKGSVVVFRGNPDYEKRHPLGEYSTYNGLVTSTNPLKVRVYGLGRQEYSKKDLLRFHEAQMNTPPSAASQTYAQSSWPIVNEVSILSQYTGWISPFCKPSQEKLKFIVQAPLEKVIKTLEDYLLKQTYQLVRHLIYQGIPTPTFIPTLTNSFDALNISNGQRPSSQPPKSNYNKSLKGLKGFYT